MEDISKMKKILNSNIEILNKYFVLLSFRLGRNLSGGFTKRFPTPPHQVRGCENDINLALLIEVFRISDVFLRREEA